MASKATVVAAEPLALSHARINLPAPVAILASYRVAFGTAQRPTSHTQTEFFMRYNNSDGDSNLRVRGHP